MTIGLHLVASKDQLWEKPGLQRREHSGQSRAKVKGMEGNGLEPGCG